MNFSKKINAAYEIQMVESPDGDKIQIILPLLQEALMAEFQQWDLYYAYKASLKGLARQSLAEEFKDHADAEASHIDIVQRYIVGYGAIPTTQRKEIPALEKGFTAEDLINVQLKFELEAVQLYSQIIKLLPEGSPLKVDLETILSDEQEHAHDLELLLGI
jgi:bacterioferritin (cytochrome b1)